MELITEINVDVSEAYNGTRWCLIETLVRIKTRRFSFSKLEYTGYKLKNRYAPFVFICYGDLQSPMTFVDHHENIDTGTNRSISLPDDQNTLAEAKNIFKAKSAFGK